MKIFFYKKSNDRQPVKEFINGLGVKNAAKIYGCLKSIEMFGLNDVRLDYRHIKDKLWELKIGINDGSIRIFYVVMKQKNIILLHAYKKKSQKAPKQELQIAFTRAKEVLNF